MSEKKKKKNKKAGTSLQEINISSPGSNLQSYISSVHGIGILSAEEEKKLAQEQAMKEEEEKRIAQEKIKKRKEVKLSKIIKDRGYLNSKNWSEDEIINLIYEFGMQRAMFKPNSEKFDNIAHEIRVHKEEELLKKIIKAVNSSVLKEKIEAIENWVLNKSEQWFLLEMKNGNDYPLSISAFSIFKEMIDDPEVWQTNWKSNHLSTFYNFYDDDGSFHRVYIDTNDFNQKFYEKNYLTKKVKEKIKYFKSQKIHLSLKFHDPYMMNCPMIVFEFTEIK